MNPAVADQVRALQKMSKLYPAKKAENAAKIKALLSNENVKNSQMAESSATESFTNGLLGAMANYSPVNATGSLLGYTGRVLGNKTLTETGEGLSEPIRQSQRDFSQQAGSKLGYQAGNITGAIASSIASPAGKAGVVVNMLRYGLPALGNTSQAIQESGGSRTAQAVGGAASGATEGALGAFLNYATLGRVPASSKLFSTLARRSLVAGLSGAAENSAEQTIDNLIAQRTYDRNRPWYEQVPQAAITGMAMGALSRAAPELYARRKRLDEVGAIRAPGENPKNLNTNNLEAQKYTNFDDYYAANKSGFDDFGLNRDQARQVYELGLQQKAIASGAEGQRVSSSAQSEFEIAQASGNIKAAREAAQRIEDPIARRAAMQSVGMDVSGIPVSEGITNPIVKRMMEEAARRKAGL